MPNMDFVIRECRAVAPEGEPMLVVRLGTCGAVQRPAKLGNLLIASCGSVCIRSGLRVGPWDLKQLNQEHLQMARTRIIRAYYEAKDAFSVNIQLNSTLESTMGYHGNMG